MFGIELSDRLALARQGELLATREPAGDSQAAAVAQWLAEVWPEGESRELWVATGAGVDATSMGELLRVLRAAQFNVQGFVDSVAAVAGWQRLPGYSIAAQLDGPQLLISVVSNDGHATELQRTVRIPGGSARLHDAWLRLAAQTLVQQTRFDPLHDRHQESALRAALPAIAESAARDGQGAYTIQVAGQALSLVLTRDQLADAAQPILQPAALALQTLSAGMPDATLLVGEQLAALPGADAMLDAARVTRALRLSAGSAACAASLLAPAPALASGAVQYLTRVPNPVTDGAMEGADSTTSAWLPALQTREAGGIMATHLIYRGRAVPIGHDALVIGRDPRSPLELKLPDGIAGLSRRHCTLRRERGRALLIDHSSHGSYIDGIRVRGRAFLTAGSVLRLGTPGLDLHLVALDAGGAEA